jgi:predicted transcriptional regulator
VTAILLSVRPRFAHAILDGTKSAEVRRRFPSQPDRATVFLYSSSPERAVLGTVHLDAIDRPAADDVWKLYHDRIEIEQASLNDYLEDVDAAAILRISAPYRWSTPVPLSDLRRLVGVEPPQSFRYLDAAQSEKLTRLGLPVSAQILGPRLVAVG